MLALVGVFYPYNRGGLFTALIVLYALTAGIAGYMAASYYRQMEGGSWVRNLLVTCLIYCGPFFLIFCFNNTVAWIYRVRCPAHSPAGRLCMSVVCAPRAHQAEQTSACSMVMVVCGSDLLAA